MDDMLREAKRIEEYLIQFRRDLHENPELSGEEYRTQEKSWSSWICWEFPMRRLEIPR